MNFFNRKEVFMTFDFDAAVLMRAKIESHQINCQMICKSANRSSRKRTSYFSKPDLVEYRLYVHRNDEQLAIHAMNCPIQ